MYQNEITATLPEELHPRTIRQAPLSAVSTFGIGGKVSVLLSPENEDELLLAVIYAKSNGIPFRVIGNGSNLLFSDNGFNGIIIRTVKLRSITLENGLMRADCGVMLPRLCSFAAQSGLGGLHGLSGIPGTVGGAIAVSAGAYGCNICDTLVSCRVLYTDSCEVREKKLAPNVFSYRKSPFTDGMGRKAIILSALFKPFTEPSVDIQRKICFCRERRYATQPCNQKSAGSYFLRPEPDLSAARLIDQAGLKGFTVGGASVSEKHAGFIVNKGFASCRDVLFLAEEVKERVYSLFGILLSEEVIFVNHNTESGEGV